MTIVAKRNNHIYWQQWLHLGVQSHTFPGSLLWLFSSVLLAPSSQDSKGENTNSISDAELKPIPFCGFSEFPKASSHFEGGFSIPGKFLNPPDLFYTLHLHKGFNIPFCLFSAKALHLLLLASLFSTQMSPIFRVSASLRSITSNSLSLIQEVCASPALQAFLDHIRPTGCLRVLGFFVYFFFQSQVFLLLLFLFLLRSISCKSSAVQTRVRFALSLGPLGCSGARGFFCHLLKLCSITSLENF